MNEFSATTVVAADHPCLPGHFPGRPVVPAVLLLERVAEALRARLGPLRILGVASAKFLRPVLPGERIEIRIQVETGSARFRCLVPGESSATPQLAAQGELRFAVETLTRA